MLYVILVVILLAVLVVGGFGFAIFWLVRSRNTKKIALKEPVLEARLTDTSVVDTCARCGEKHIIIRLDDRLCAFCYSSLRTKKS